MRLVVAMIKPAQIESVRQALGGVEVTRMTVCDTHGYDLAAPDSVAQEAMLEIAVNDDFVDRTVAAITGVLTTGADTTSRVHVLPMADAAQIYRAVRGPEAV
ncbi:MAG: P-II family nitrogen regulator [Planctomycetaceae bacterium]